MEHKSHYGGSLNPSSLEEFTDIGVMVLRELIEFKGPGTIPVLVYRGMSGVAHATALALACHREGILIEQVYVRKPGEESHGYSVEHRRQNFDVFSSKSRAYIFIDDFIDSGKTLQACFDILVGEKEWVNPQERLFGLTSRGLLTFRWKKPNPNEPQRIWISDRIQDYVNLEYLGWGTHGESLKFFQSEVKSFLAEFKNKKEELCPTDDSASKAS